MDTPILLALSYDSKATAQNTTWVVRNEINSTQTVNVTCEPDTNPKVVTFGEAAHITAQETVLLIKHRCGACHFRYLGRVLAISTTGDVISHKKNFIKFNETGPYRRNSEMEKWLYNDNSTLVPFYGP